jgi:hypothetical protein
MANDLRQTYVFAANVYYNRARIARTGERDNIRTPMLEFRPLISKYNPTGVCTDPSCLRAGWDHGFVAVE